MIKVGDTLILKISGTKVILLEIISFADMDMYKISYPNGDVGLASSEAFVKQKKYKVSVG